MSELHPTADQLLDYVSDRLESANTDVVDHLANCTLCRVHLDRLRKATRPYAPASALSTGEVEAPSLSPAIQRLLNARPDSPPTAGEVWRVGLSTAHLAWVRKVLDAETLDVIPLVLDIDMADDESLIIPPEQTDLELPLAAITPLRTHIHTGSMLGLLGRLDIASEIEDLIAASKGPRESIGVPTGLAITDPGDSRLEYRQVLREELSQLSPSAWAMRARTKPGTPAVASLDIAGQPATVISTTAGPSQLNDAALDRDFAELRNRLHERLGGSVRTVRCAPLTRTTDIGTFTTLAKVHYIDTSVLVVSFNPLGNAGVWLPSASQAAGGVHPLLSAEVHAAAVALSRTGELHDSLLMTRAAMRPALELPDGGESDAVITLAGMSLLDAVAKYLDGEPTLWEVLDRAEVGIPTRKITDQARAHALRAIAKARKSGSMSQPLKKEIWTQLSDDFADVVAAFVTSASEEGYDAALRHLGIESE